MRQDTAGDYIGRSFSILMLAVPGFWMGTMVMVFPSIWWGWSPDVKFMPFTQAPLHNLKQMIIPAVILGTTESSWHSVSPVDPPAGRRQLSRKSFAFYLYTDLAPDERNAVEHSAARHITVTLCGTTDTLYLTIRDDGRGFDPAQATAAGGFGLLSMRARAAAIGAELTLSSALGRGTTLVVALPRH